MAFQTDEERPNTPDRILKPAGTPAPAQHNLSEPPDRRTEIRIGWRATMHIAIGVAGGIFAFVLVNSALNAIGVPSAFGVGLVNGRAIGK